MMKMTVVIFIAKIAVKRVTNPSNVNIEVKYAKNALK